MINTERGGSCMKELLKNKLMIGCFIFILAFTYVSATNQQKMEEDSRRTEQQYVAMNVQ